MEVGRRGEWCDKLFFFSSRRRYTRCLSDWSSDVCSSDLTRPRFFATRCAIPTGGSAPRSPASTLTCRKRSRACWCCSFSIARSAPSINFPTSMPRRRCSLAPRSLWSSNSDQLDFTQVRRSEFVGLPAELREPGTEPICVLVDDFVDALPVAPALAAEAQRHAATHRGHQRDSLVDRTREQDGLAQARYAHGHDLRFVGKWIGLQKVHAPRNPPRPGGEVIPIVIRISGKESRLSIGWIIRA